MDLKIQFTFYLVTHIYRQFNQVVDFLSKISIGQMDVTIHLVEVWEETTISIRDECFLYVY